MANHQLTIDFNNAELLTDFEQWLIEHGWDAFENETGTDATATLTSENHLAGITLTGAD